MIVRDADWVWVVSLAVIIAFVVAATLLVLIEKPAEVAPAGIKTVDGTVASAEFDKRLTTKPPLGAGPLSFTTPVAPVPPSTDEGLNWSDVNPAGLTYKVADLKPVPTAAVTPTTL